MDGQDDPKSNFTLERLHEVAKERSLERKKKKRKRELESDGVDLDCVEETCKAVKRLGFCDKLAPVKKKLKKRDQPMLTYESMYVMNVCVCVCVCVCVSHLPPRIQN